MKYDWKFWAQMDEAALLYEQTRRFLPISVEKDQRHCRDRKYSNTMTTVYLAKYRGRAMLAIAAGPSVNYGDWPKPFLMSSTVYITQHLSCHCLNISGQRLC